MGGFGGSGSRPQGGLPLLRTIIARWCLFCTPTGSDSPHRLHQQILRFQVATMQRRDLCPSVEQISLWIQQARSILDFRF